MVLRRLVASACGGLAVILAVALPAEQAMGAPRSKLDPASRQFSMSNRPLPAWDPCTPITYGVKGPAQLVKSERPIFRQAFRALTKYTGIRFKAVSPGRAMVTIKLDWGGGNGFGGGYGSTSSGMLSYPPNAKLTSGGTIDIFTRPSIRPRLRRLLAAHEMMHVLHIRHSPDPTSIMFYYYEASDPFAFNAWDRLALKAVSRSRGCMPSPRPLDTVEASVVWESGSPTLTLSARLPKDPTIEDWAMGVAGASYYPAEPDTSDVVYPGAWCGDDGLIRVNTETVNKWDLTKRKLTVRCSDPNRPADSDINSDTFVAY